ncbi:MAG: hypothetical protein GQ570_05640 [Helicobacteraceae bacterium]|nr:hypothetical protein [Helicobacteraceae bacterium]
MLEKMAAATNAGLNTNTTDETILTEDIESSDSKPMSSEKDTTGASTIFGHEPKEIPSAIKSASAEEELVNSGHTNVLFYTPEEAAAMQLQDDEIISNIQDKIKEINDNEADLSKEIKESNQRKLIKFILLARIILDAKFVLGSRFYGVVNKDVMSSKQVLIYLRFLMTTASQKLFDASVKAKKEDISLIVVDLRIASLTEKKIEKLTKPFMSKLIDMKPLSNEDFDAVIGGDDKKYNEIIDGIKKKKDGIAKTKKYAQKPDTMDTDTFDELLKQGVYEITRKYQASMDKEIELLEQINQLKQSNEALEKEKLQLEASSSITEGILNKFIPTQSPYGLSKEHA